MTPEDRVRAAVEELADAIMAAATVPKAAADAPERLYSVDDARQALGGIGRSLIYTEMQAGRLRALHVGRRVLISASAIDAYIASR
jgi:excisionase family DNA binding protein